MKELPLEVFALPAMDDRFLRLNDAARDLVTQRLGAMQLIHQSPDVSKGCRAVAALHAGEYGWSVGRLRAFYYSFTAWSGDWTVLLNRARAGADWQATVKANRMPGKMLEWLGSRWALNQRDKFKTVFVELRTRYLQARGGVAEAVKFLLAELGYARVPEPLDTTGLPHGWTYANLKRLANKVASRYARKLVQIGSKAASDFTPPILCTRAGHAVGQVVMIDDSKNDSKFLWRGSPVDVLSFHLLDFASGCNVLRGHKPVYRDENEVKESLKEREVLFLLQAYFSTHGFLPKLGTKIVCEKSTATVRKADAEFLHQLSGGMITVDTGPAGGGPGIAGLFNGRAAGNPRWKASIESWFNLERNRKAGLLEFPGQTGSNSRLNAPEGLEKLCALDRATARASELLTPEVAALVRFNLLDYWNGTAALDAVTDAINSRDDHGLEGWRSSGNVVPAFRVERHLPWLPAAVIPTLPPGTQDWLAVKLQSDPQLCGELWLSPQQVWTRGAGALKKFTAAQSALLLARIAGDEVNVRESLLPVNCPELDPDEPVCFGPICRDGRGGERPLKHGEKYLVRVNPLAPGAAFIYGADGGWLGYAEHWGRAGRTDTAALTRKFAAKHHAVALLNAEAKQLAAPLTKRATQIAEHNAAVMAGQFSTGNIPVAAGDEDVADCSEEFLEP